MSELNIEHGLNVDEHESSSIATESQEAKQSKLKQAYRILNRDRLLCMNMNTDVLFDSTYDNEQRAIRAEEELKELGLLPTRTGNKIHLRAVFSTEEIKEAESYTVSIKSEEKREAEKRQREQQ